MSQEKVDRYKEQKANRKQIMKHEKRMHRLEMTGLAVVCAAVVLWFGFSVYQEVQGDNNTANTERSVNEMNVDGIRDYMLGLQGNE